ncbi:MAG: PKD domain-containing protein [Thermoplasmata archaeon]
MAFRNRCTALLIVSLVTTVAVMTVSSSLGFVLLTPGGSRGISPDSSIGLAEHGGSYELTLASASLCAGDGPSSGSSLTCSSVGAGTDRCGPLTPNPDPAGTGGYVWANLSSLVGSTPSPRYGSEMTWDASDGYVLFYGGENNFFIAYADTWTYFGGIWTNITSSVSGTPPPAAGGGLAYDAALGKVVLFGGLNATGGYSDYTWTYHAMSWTNVTATAGTPPSPRVLPAFSADSTNGQLVLFGGRSTAFTWLQDTWTFGNGTWVNVTSTLAFAMPLILNPVLTDDPAGHGALLFGAAVWGVAAHPTTFIFANGAWQNLTPSLLVSPNGPYYGAGIYVSSLSAVLVVSAAQYNASGSVVFSPETWEFTGGAWVNVTNFVGTVADATGGLLPGIAADPVDQSIILFGGNRTLALLPPPAYSNYTWAFSAPPKVSASASLTVADAGVPVTFTGVISAGLSPNSAKWSFGDGTTDVGLSLAHTYAHAGVYVANFTGTDLAGASSTTSVTVLVNAALAAAVTLAPTSPVAGSAIGFFPTVSGGTAPFTYAWSFGDGSTSTAAAPSHTYSGSGSYTVKLTVTDALGVSSNSTQAVSVSSAPSTSVSLTSGTGLYLLLGVLLLLVVVVVLAILLLRKRQPPRSVPAPYATTAPSPPPAQPAIYDEGPPTPPPPG